MNAMGKAGLRQTVQTGDVLFAFKAIAIIMAVAAHCSSYTMELPCRIGALFGTLGVPVFYFLSGVFFKAGTKRFWRKKVRTIVVPWLVWGSLTFALSLVISGNPATGTEYIKWMIGSGTFVPVLLLCFALFSFCQNTWWSVTLIVIWVISHTLTVLSVLENGVWITNYQNVFNWIGYFAIGNLVGKLGVERLIQIIVRWRYAVCAGAVLLAAVYVWLDVPSYWTVFSAPCQLLCGAALLCVSCSAGKSRLMVDIGKNTYPIYFAHMQIGIGLLNRLVMKRLLPALGWGEYAAAFLWPALVVLVTYAMVKLGAWLAKRIGLGRYLWILGIDRV